MKKYWSMQKNSDFSQFDFYINLKYINIEKEIQIEIADFFNHGCENYIA